MLAQKIIIKRNMRILNSYPGPFYSEFVPDWMWNPKGWPHCEISPISNKIIFFDYFKKRGWLVKKPLNWEDMSHDT